MPDVRPRGRRYEIFERSTTPALRFKGAVATQIRSRHPATGEGTCSAKAVNDEQLLPNLPRPHSPDTPQHPVNQIGSSEESIPDRKGKSVRPPNAELSLSEGTSDPFVTDDILSGGIIESLGVTRLGNGASNSVLASSSAPASKHHARPVLASLVSEYAELSISPVRTSKSRHQNGVGSSAIQEPEEDSEPLLPPELVQDVLGHMEWRAVMRLRSQLGQANRDAIYQPAFRRSRPRAEAEYSPCYFTTDAAGDLHMHGFDIKRRKYARLPSLNFAKKRAGMTIIPSPDPDLFKDYLVAGDGGLLCMNVGKSTGRVELVVCNPLTRQAKVLPPPKHPRHPVLMHFKVGADSGHYKIVIAGSAAIGTDDLSRKTEEYESTTGEWTCPPKSDMPCPHFGLNEYQNGVYFTDSERELLLCVAITGTRGRGVLAYDLKTHEWIPDLTRFQIPLVRGETHVGSLATTQIVECGGQVFVFSEQECGKEVFFLIHKLNLDGPAEEPWEEILRRKRAAGRGLLVYPEFSCVAVSEHELGIFNTVERTIELIDLNHPAKVAPFQAAPRSHDSRFHSLNPIGFVYGPSFKYVVCPRGLLPASLCQYYAPGKYCSECERRDPLSNRHKKFVVLDRQLNGSEQPEKSPEVRTAQALNPLYSSRGKNAVPGTPAGLNISSLVS